MKNNKTLDLNNKVHTKNLLDGGTLIIHNIESKRKYTMCGDLTYVSLYLSPIITILVGTAGVPYILVLQSDCSNYGFLRLTHFLIPSIEHRVSTISACGLGQNLNFLYIKPRMSQTRFPRTVRR